MKYSLFRFSDVLEAFGIYLMCFTSNLLLVYVQISNVEVASLLEGFIESIVDYRLIISISLTFTMIVFHYQFLNRKKTEISCRILVGDTREGIITRYMLNSLTILMFSFVASLLLGLYLNVIGTSNLYLVFIFILYILVSAGQVTNK
ncbi:hypothetical protein EVJ33_08610 [Exiguobacterium sp. SL-10]|nr:hypothetical protein EVJ34_10410 [Exiguobacterium sp. SL-9]TCI29705.1 hypothetical protein EVJ33_08610 [Exiguobacterium sp. SL-10]